MSSKVKVHPSTSPKRAREKTRKKSRSREEDILEDFSDDDDASSSNYTEKYVGNLPKRRRNIPTLLQSKKKKRGKCVHWKDPIESYSWSTEYSTTDGLDNSAAEYGEYASLLEPYVDDEQHTGSRDFSFTRMLESIGNFIFPPVIKRRKRVKKKKKKKHIYDCDDDEVQSYCISS